MQLEGQLSDLDLVAARRDAGELLARDDLLRAVVLQGAVAAGAGAR